MLNEYAPNFKSAVIDRQVLAPPDLERVFNLTGGNIFQGAMTPGQLFAFRPVPGYARYRTPIRGLYLCGSAAHPGGGVMGTPGLNAAREILGWRKLRPSRLGSRSRSLNRAQAWLSAPREPGDARRRDRCELALRPRRRSALRARRAGWRRSKRNTAIILRSAIDESYDHDSTKMGDRAGRLRRRRLQRPSQ